MDDLISRKAAINEIRRFSGYLDEDMINRINIGLNRLPSAQPEWNDHTVACLLAELFNDDCACNYNGIDEWLPSKCELLDSCPHPAGVACWEQFLTHRKERRTNE